MCFLFIAAVALRRCGRIMKYVLVYWSRYGHNKRLVEYLASLLQQKGAQTEIYTTEKADPSKLPSALCGVIL